MKSLLYLGAASVLLLTGFRSVYNISQPPVASTGAPGETNCSRCHTGSLNMGGGSVDLAGLPRGGYQPGVVYPLTVTVTDNAMQVFGFELQALNTTTNTAAGTLTATTPTNTVVRANGSKSYISHRNATTTSTWTFNWTAPTTGTPTVRFYLAGVAANSNRNNQGDRVYTANFPLAPEPTGLAEDAAAAALLSVFPNPAAGRSVTLTGTALAKAQLVLVYDASGRLVRQQAPTAALDVQGLAAGRYTVAVVGADERAVRRVLVVQP